MSVYVDPLANHGWLMRGKRIPNCHLVADTEKELHKFARGIGMKLNWFQGKRLPHYDLTEGKRRQAVRAGAIEMSREEFVGWMRANRKKEQNDEKR